MIVEESGKEILLFDVLDFDDDSLFLILCKQVILSLDVSNCRRVFVLGVNLIYVDRDTQDILRKLTEHNRLTENPFESCTVFERNDFDHPVYLFN